jgi:hypothetical protein
MKYCNRIALAVVLIIATAFAQLDYAEAQISPTQITELCGTSNMQSVGGSGFSGNQNARISAMRCEPSINGYIISIFNGVESIQCNDLPSQNPQSVTFGVAMTCTGSENGGRGITGSIKYNINGSSNTQTSIIEIANGLTQTDIPVILDSPDLPISGRTCSLSLFADLYALDPNTGKCVKCVNAYVVTNKDTCGSISDDDDCGFFNIVCQFDEGTWAYSAFFWILFDFFVMFLVPMFAYVIILNQRRDAERRTFHTALAASTRTTYSEDFGRPITKQQYKTARIREHGLKYGHDGSVAFQGDARKMGGTGYVVNSSGNYNRLRSNQTHSSNGAASSGGSKTVTRDNSGLYVAT